jgi:hypothetical protein
MGQNFTVKLQPVGIIEDRYLQKQGNSETYQTCENLMAQDSPSSSFMQQTNNQVVNPNLELSAL